MLSSQLTLTPNVEHCDSQEDPCLELAIIPTVLDIVPLASYPPSLNDNRTRWGEQAARLNG